MKKPYQIESQRALKQLEEMAEAPIVERGSLGNKP